MSEAYTLEKRYGPIPLGPFKIEFILLQVHITNAHLPNDQWENYFIVDSMMANPEHALYTSRNEQPLNFAVMSVTGKKIKVFPFGPGPITIIVFGT